MQRTEKTIEINAPVERVFDLFSDFESFPRWMSHIREVRYTGRRYTRWTADAPLGSSVEWEAETTHFEPDRRIAWRSVRGDVDTEGEVVFQETSRGTTLVRVVLGYDPPAGRFGAMVARLFGSNPEQQMEEDLERFASVAEERETRRARGYFDEQRGGRSTTTARRASHGPRMYGEELRDRRGRAATHYEEADDDERRYFSRPPVERAFYERRRDEDDRGYRQGHYVDDRPRSRGEGRERFEREVREALRSQRESLRRYDEESRNARRGPRPERYERDERPHVHDERGPADERRLYEGRMRARSTRRGEDDRRPSQQQPPPPPTRHALTPREREMERRRRRPRPDSEYPRKAFSRGVDKLLDEDDAPSSRWRRW
ncbi:MAG TPA: SRPBCC family protein [Pyrinomonadaceae bacterium]|jgi:uncharacterized protein YndB with AHSA1/START domain|nr:SRPBCC family protein [Pyrinomonadaceae bacterium]